MVTVIGRHIPCQYKEFPKKIRSIKSWNGLSVEVMEHWVIGDSRERQGDHFTSRASGFLFCKMGIMVPER